MHTEQMDRVWTENGSSYRRSDSMSYGSEYILTQAIALLLYSRLKVN
jgi:hypothetical protein